MKRVSTNLALGYVPQQPSTKFGQTVLQAAILLQKLNACSINNLKKYMANGHNKSIVIPISNKEIRLEDLSETNRLPHSDMRVKSGSRRQKTQDGFFQVVLKEMDDLDIPSLIEQLLLPINPLGASRVLLYHLDLMSHVSKSQNCTALAFILFFSLSFIGNNRTTSADEVEAIKVALALLNARPSLSVQTVIFLNSQAVILAFAECSQTPGSISSME
ncbi:hypothetical protein TNIN_352131 [Trichonephila inaurata madagascariensis]|uniref:Uncharacterized protein n=1 Tax=Trichonephila inaurata madagascariensis TaxID=2747483 RepID=A0A8X6YJF0_9ARAC|nr:hypothetical protein TNIN_352131 [Trichonephila inaurata madagascariensis]